MHHTSCLGVQLPNLVCVCDICMHKLGVKLFVYFCMDIFGNQAATILVTQFSIVSSVVLTCPKISQCRVTYHPEEKFCASQYNCWRSAWWTLFVTHKGKHRSDLSPQYGPLEVSWTPGQFLPNLICTNIYTSKTLLLKTVMKSECKQDTNLLNQTLIFNSLKQCEYVSPLFSQLLLWSTFYSEYLSGGYWSSFSNVIVWK